MMNPYSCFFQVTEFYNVDEKGGLLKQLRSKKMKASDGAPPSGSASSTTNTAPSKSILKQPATSIHTLYEVSTTV